MLEKLLHAGTIASVGGERKDISVLFSDIRNFTSVSENVAPEKLMMHVSEYLSVVTNIIHQCSGNVDKFIGDSVMAFWGAPLEDDQHIQHACLAALLCHREICILNEKWRSIDKPVFYTRFGVNTGMAVVGNMGSFDRLNYTAIGDEVNLTARLEQANKVYGTQIIVSEAVYQACHENLLFRPIDIFVAKGRTHATAIYELVAMKTGREDLLATAGQLELCKLTIAAFAAFQGGKMDIAFKLYKEILAKFPEDPVASYYLNRIQA